MPGRASLLPCGHPSSWVKIGSAVGHVRVPPEEIMVAWREGDLSEPSARKACVLILSLMLMRVRVYILSSVV